MIRLLGWCALVAGLVALGWFGRDLASALDRAPVVVTVQKPASPVTVARAAPKARPARAQSKPAEYRDPPERDNVHPGFTTQGIGYYDVRGTY
jgi:hypothetical protein